MSYWIEIILYVLVSIAFASLAFSSVYFLIKSREYANRWAQAEADKLVLRERLSELAGAGDSRKVEQTEGFVRFISQSRDMAFTYIEDVQKDIAELKDYFDKNGLNLTVEKADRWQ